MTAVFSDHIWVENADRSVGVKVTSAPWWVNEGDDVKVTGNVMLLDGIKQVVPVGVILPISSGNALPELGMRHRDVGGKDYDAADPGITDGRGPLNVGLYVTVQGMVTKRDSTGYCYIWDGSNMYITGESDPRPIDDGTGNRGIRIAHNGWMAVGNGQVPNVARALVPWKDFVTVKGIVTVNKTVVPGKTIPVILPKSITIESTFNTISDAGAGLKAGANLFSITAQPAKTGNGADPAGGTNPMPWEVPTLFAPNDPANTSVSQIYRWENGNLSQYLYDPWSPDAFGGMLMNDGYWVFLASDWPVSYSGKTTTIPQWHAIPQAGESWIGLPKSTAIELEDVKLHDGGQVVSFRDADQNGLGWVQSTGFYWNNVEQSQYDMGLWDDWPSGGTTMDPWRGYIFQMFQPDKAWIIP